MSKLSFPTEPLQQVEHTTSKRRSLSLRHSLL